MRSRALALLVLLSAALACAPRADPHLVAQPISSRTWVSTLRRDHPLAGKIWDQGAGRFVDEATLAAALAAADVVLLGETHDNVDHHLLQARLVRTMFASGRKPALAFEMLTSDLQPSIDAALARAPRDPDALAKPWKAGGWPDFESYRPILQEGLAGGATVLAANLPRKTVREAVSKGAEALDGQLRARLARSEPLPKALVESLRAEMRESHCGQLPESMLDPLVLAQRARDAEMAVRVESAGERGAILVAGRGHVRTDRGVPAYLRSDGPRRKVVAVGFFEVESDQRQPGQYVEQGESGPLPFDFAVFTPAQEREDPCEGLRHRAHVRAARERQDAKEGKGEAAAPKGPPRPAEEPGR